MAVRHRRNWSRADQKYINLALRPHVHLRAEAMARQHGVSMNAMGTAAIMHFATHTPQERANLIALHLLTPDNLIDNEEQPSCSNGHGTGASAGSDPSQSRPSSGSDPAASTSETSIPEPSLCPASGPSS